MCDMGSESTLLILLPHATRTIFTGQYSVWSTNRCAINKEKQQSLIVDPLCGETTIAIREFKCDDVNFVITAGTAYAL